jgi:hypothetical protein
VALSVIIILYLGIGVLSAVGSIAISRQRFSAKAEPIFYGFLLAPIAAIYLAFTAYFGADIAWRLEALAVALFAVFGMLGIRIPVILMLGYVLHGVWDLFHEAGMHIGVGVGGANSITEVPLAYGVFCAAYDWCMAGYFYTRRDQWKAAKKATAT